MNKKLQNFLLLIIALAAVSLFAYYAKPVAQASNPIAPPPSVEIKTIEPEKVDIWSEFSGRLQAVESADIRPEVNGRITEVRFEDGDIVHAGDILFIIDPRPYEAALAKAEATLATAMTNANFSKIEVERAEKMIKTQAIAQRIYDERYNSDQVAIAAIKSAEAEVLQANVNLDHAYLKAPISGRIGRVELTVGNIVQAGPNAPLMTRIIAYNPIYADFEVDEQTYIQSVRNIADDRFKERLIPVELYIKGDKSHTYQGNIYTFDNRIDTSSGTIRARAKFDNPDGVLIPGMFVTVRIATSKDDEVLMIPQQAISSDQSKKYVYVVDNDNKVVYRQVEVGKEVQSQRIILNGLAAGDRVIVKGLQHVKPGDIVEIKQ